eukprot:1152304-Alexandrium_andersonii.AAC.1
MRPQVSGTAGCSDRLLVAWGCKTLEPRPEAGRVRKGAALARSDPCSKGLEVGESGLQSTLVLLRDLPLGELLVERCRVQKQIVCQDPRGHQDELRLHHGDPRH